MGIDGVGQSGGVESAQKMDDKQDQVQKHIKEALDKLKDMINGAMQVGGSPEMLMDMLQAAKGEAGGDVEAIKAIEQAEKIIEQVASRSELMGSNGTDIIKAIQDEIEKVAGAENVKAAFNDLMGNPGQQIPGQENAPLIQGVEASTMSSLA
jgi:hypothetical protein